MYEFYHYLPVDDSIMQWGMYLTGVGRGVIPSRENYPPSGHPTLYSFNYNRGRVLPEFQLVLITDGGGVFETKETGEIPVKDNTFFILFPDTWHRYKPDDDTGWKERWISFNGTIAHSLMEGEYLSPKSSIFYLSKTSPVIKEFDKFLNAIHKAPSENTILQSLKTMAFLSSIIEITSENKKESNSISKQQSIHECDALVSMVLDLIWTQSHRPISIDWILKQVPASRRTLERRFQEFCGHTIHDEIIKCRLSRAKRILCETDMPIKSVAYLSGFSCLERMRCAFKQNVGVTPSEFRKISTDL